MLNHISRMKFEKISRLETAWERLFKFTPDVNPFISYAWFRVYCADILKNDPEVITFYNNNKIVGILPAIISDNKLLMLGDDRVTDKAGFLFQKEYVNSMIGKFVNFVKENDIYLDFKYMVKGDYLYKNLIGSELDLNIELDKINPVLRLSTLWERYMSALNRKSRHEIRRKLKKAKDVRIKNISSDSIEELFNLMSASSEDKKRFLKNDIRSFFKDIAYSFEKRDWLRLRALLLGRNIISIIFAFKLDGKIYLYNSGFDPYYRILSPGIITILLDIKDAISEGYGIYDFLRGDEEYKYKLGAEKEYIVRLKT